MERLGQRPGQSVWKSLNWIGATLAALVAATIGAVLAVFFTLTVVVIALMSTVLLFFTGAAMRARRTASARTGRADDGVLEARNVGGHSWVAYGWDSQPR